MLSGALFVACAANAVTAISLIGLSAATGVWCGTAVLVSFSYGVLVAGDSVQRLGLAALALGLILFGIAGVALAAWAGGKEETSDAAGFLGVCVCVWVGGWIGVPHAFPVPCLLHF